VGALPTPSASLRRLHQRVAKAAASKRSEDGPYPAGKAAAARQANSKPLTKGNPMKPTIRHQSQLLFRRSYKPKRVIRIRPLPRLNIVFRPVNRFGVKPQLTIVS
jgi:hypothetical protein